LRRATRTHRPIAAARETGADAAVPIGAMQDAPVPRGTEPGGPWSRWPRCHALVAVLIAGCAAGPPYQVPSTPTPPAFKEAPAAGAAWLPAAPADALDRGDWWTLFGDPDLSGLAAQVTVSNQNVAAAVAAYAQAQALVREQRAALFPALGLDVSARRSGGRGSASSSGTALQASLGASWEPDLWGRLRNTVDAATAGAAASEADLAAARLSAQGELAINYFSLREADAEIELLRSAVEAYERSLQITQNRYTVGVIAKTDVLQAETQLASTRADLAALQGQRARLEHAIAVLIGKAPADFALAPAPWRHSVPAVPLGVPSLLLQRRPDIAAAERDVAAANAQIGIQRSAYFPNLSLSGSLGAAGSRVADLFSASGTLWALGVSVAQTVFDAGATRARVAGAEASRDAAIARYRQTVLSAFQAVEDQLATTRVLVEQEALRREASAAADATEAQILNRYRAGQLNYTEVVTAQVSALNARRALLQLALSRQTSAVALIQALGGGWHQPFSAAQASRIETP
jgi:NodT family efflux transporter outer membrane factor (OMF) lipoprotein